MESPRAPDRPPPWVIVLPLLLMLVLLLGAGSVVVGVRDAGRWVRHTEAVRFEIARLQGGLGGAGAGPAVARRLARQVRRSEETHGGQPGAAATARRGRAAHRRGARRAE